jgi:outer membrane lipoprotein-sorting protein
MNMAQTGRRYFFVAKNTKTKSGYTIEFLNIPQLYASGVTYIEAVYYSYRVLADFLNQLPDDEAALAAYTLSSIPDNKDDTFYTIISVPGDFDPHKMQTTFTIAQSLPEEIRNQADKLSHLVDYDNPIAL